MPGEPMDATPFIPPRARSLKALAAAVDDCRGCPISRADNHAVFGEGRARARLVLIGEQPGDQEDRAGRPFVGPAGRELNARLEAAGIDREEAYLTNAVKRFKYEGSGKRRLHDKPDRSEVRACRPWLDRELDLIRPEAIVALGATAAQELFGAAFRVTKMHGDLVETELAPLAMATIHPSAILRARDDADRSAKRKLMTEDLLSLAALLG